MTCCSAALMHLGGARLAKGDGFPGDSSGLSSSCFLVTAPETGDERDLLFLARGRRARA